MKTKKTISFVLLLFILSAANAQIRISSPYTRYGIGDLLNNKYIRNLSMGGVSIGYRSPYCVNYSNPASFSAFDSLSFMFESGVNSQITQLKTNTQENISNYTSLSYLVFGFPVTKWWGASMGLLPYSSVGYNIINEEVKENIGLLDYYYQGAGGCNQFYIGNGFRIKNLSFGFNSSFIFGSLDKVCMVTQYDSADFLNTKARYSTVINDFLFNYGVQYQKNISKRIQLNAGLVYNASTNLNSKQDSLVYRYFYSEAENLEIIKDTIINSLDNKGLITLPQGIGIGFAFVIKDKKALNDKWTIAADYQTQDWKNYKYFGIKDSLSNNHQLSMGLELIPNGGATTQRWKRAHYRLGFRYNQTYLKIQDTQLNEMAISFGLGLPLRKSKTTLNFGFEIGQRGTTDKDLVKENFAKISFILSLNEKNWFLKHRFD